MTPKVVKAFVQARMSSQRFPGKVLAPFQGKPLVWHVLTSAAHACLPSDVVLVTSDEASDDPLALFAQSIGYPVFRGPRENVFERFRLCAKQHPCEWILRINADSPLLDARLLQVMASHAGQTDCDLVTTIFPRTFPKGQNAELIRTSTFMAIDEAALLPDEREHVTPYFYRNQKKIRIVNVDSGNPQLAELSLAVDTVEDLQRLERFSQREVQDLLSQIVLLKTAG